MNSNSLTEQLYPDPVQQNYLGMPPVLRGEDAHAYRELLARVTDRVSPSDIFEEIWVREIVDYVWSAIRLRRLKTTLLNSSFQEGLQNIIRRLPATILSQLPTNSNESDSGDPVVDLVNRWMERDMRAVQTVKKLLFSAGMSLDDVTAQTYVLKLNEVEHIDRLLISAETRRNLTLREIERHRKTLAVTFRAAAADDALEIEFTKAMLKGPKPRP